MSLTKELVLKRSKADSLSDVRTLNCWGCNLVSVQLLSELENLEVLNLSCNDLDSLEDLKECKKLQEIFIRRNKLTDISEIEHLASLPNLKAVWLSGNPLCEEPNYRSQISKLLPQVQKLDNTDLHSEKNPSKTAESGESTVLQAVLLLLKELDESGLEKVIETGKTMLANN